MCTTEIIGHRRMNTKILEMVLEVRYDLGDMALTSARCGRSNITVHHFRCAMLPLAPADTCYSFFTFILLCYTLWMDGFAYWWLMFSFIILRSRGWGHLSAGFSSGRGGGNGLKSFHLNYRSSFIASVRWFLHGTTHDRVLR